LQRGGALQSGKKRRIAGEPPLLKATKPTPMRPRPAMASAFGSRAMSFCTAMRERGMYPLTPFTMLWPW
jgi:hypothetical protein